MADGLTNFPKLFFLKNDSKISKKNKKDSNHQKELYLTVKVTHKRFHLLKTKSNFYWCYNLKTDNFAGSWIRKLQSSCVHDQNANTSHIFLPALFQMSCKSFYKLLNQLESDDELRSSERGRLTIDRDRKSQINDSHEEISSVYEHIFRTNIRSLFRSNQGDKILLWPFRSAL